MDLSEAYANGPHIPGGSDYPARWARAAEAFRSEMGPRAEIGLAYGTGTRQAFDLFHPDGAASRGTVIFVHGGYWRSLARSDWSWLAAGPLGRGWTVAMPGYDLCPAVRITDITRQVAAAVQAVADRTSGPIALTGHSAGGHLVARMLDPELLPEAVAGRLVSVQPISPLADLAPLMQTNLNDDLHLDPAEAVAESPIHMTDRRDVPVSVLVGGAERPAFLDQTLWLAEAWGVERIVAKGRHHFDVIDALADPGSALVARLCVE
ncbi:alpha/beta hydrolase [Marinibacterium profundimaris]|uniref:Esterase n=1 Tax=Marinibacterium profundimaris TaxID=1679460 RepID=A0A225NNV5_9RHOB|nr:alpha/beta hydrolase [Marinibacterium profundimaris]OWU75969.1 esterase [Marinibacterium profundimaris]